MNASNLVISTAPSPLSVFRVFFTCLFFVSIGLAIQEPPAKAFELKPEVWEKVLGEYLYGGNQYVSVFKFSQQAEDGSLFYFDSETGRTGPLRAVSETEFESSPVGEETDTVSSDSRITFLKNSAGRVDRLLLKRSGRPDTEANRAPGFTEEPVTFASGEVTLAGRLLLPATPGRHPAVVYAHGSGPGTRHQVSLLAHFFLHRGIAVLGFDKRGIGQSSGDWRLIDFPELASDVLAAVSFLRSRPDIDPHRIGLYGISQGGWVVSLAASLSADVAFFISHSGPGVSPKKQEFTMLTNIMTRSGFSREEVDGILQAMGLLYDYGRTGKNGDKLDELVLKLKQNPKLADFLPPPSKELDREKLYEKQKMGDPGWFFHLDVDYDPIPAVKRVRYPGLFIFGKYDFTVPVEESVARIEAALEETGNGRCQVVVLPNAGHGVLEVDPAAPTKPASPMRMAEGYLKLLGDWLDKALSSQ
jgi:dipeptidyl aminopeptidase/acylaminoacyl peptidase